MATPLASTTSAGTHPGDLTQRIRARIESLAYLPTTAAVAIKFVQLGKNADAEPADYAKVISGDSSLSSKLLAVANSSWAGVRSRVTNIRMAVNLLGLGTVRTLAVSYFMTGLHNELRLSPAESELFWESSLYKAVAAKRYAGLFDPKLADEAFVAGLFQDLAAALMYSVLREPYLRLLQEPGVGCEQQLHKERELFGMDHAEVGRALALKLELPDLFVNTIAFHHNRDGLAEFVEQVPLRHATFAAGLIPHSIRSWNVDDAEALNRFLAQTAPGLSMTAYVAGVQEDFAQLYGFFNDGRTEHPQLTDLLTQTAREAADNTTALVGTINEMIRDSVSMGREMHSRVHRLEGEARHDQLTGVYNRTGFGLSAGERLEVAARAGSSFAVCYFDIDRFKSVNDTFGHAFGDVALQALVQVMRESLPSEAVIGRMGGDEFVVVLSGCTQAEVHDAVQGVLDRLATDPVCDAGQTCQIYVSAGVLFLRPTRRFRPLPELINAADKLMYRAKRGGGNQLALAVA
jgi:diguanylate cyclase (GGDEF)-like protein